MGRWHNLMGRWHNLLGRNDEHRLLNHRARLLLSFVQQPACLVFQHSSVAYGCVRRMMHGWQELYVNGLHHMTSTPCLCLLAPGLAKLGTNNRCCGGLAPSHNICSCVPVRHYRLISPVMLLGVRHVPAVCCSCCYQLVVGNTGQCCKGFH